MEAWIPFFQSLIWPIFFLVLLLVFRDWFSEVFQVIRARIEAGSEISVGAGGFTIGSAPQIAPEEKEDEVGLSEKVEAYTQSKGGDAKIPLSLMQSIYLMHGATRTASQDQHSRTMYDITVRLNADNSSLINKVSRVVYHLHPTLKNPVQEITQRDDNFEFTMHVWGQFNLKAEVYFEGSEQPLTLFRYLNF